MLKQYAKSGLPRPLRMDWSDPELEQRLYGLAGTKQGHRRRPELDWAALNHELKKKHVTLQIIWDEYIAANPGGYSYSRFVGLYRNWESHLPVTMCPMNLGCDKLFIDYAGHKVPVIIDRRTGKTEDAHLFVAVIGGSSLSFALATWTEKLPEWIEAHVQALAFIGGVNACLYDPQINRAYADLAAPPWHGNPAGAATSATR